MPSFTPDEMKNKFPTPAGASSNDPTKKVSLTPAEMAQKFSTPSNASQNPSGALESVSDYSKRVGSQDTGRTDPATGLPVKSGPFMPVSAEDLKITGPGGGAKLVAKGLANAFSDVPDVIKGLPALVEPWQWGKIAKGLLDGVSNVTKESFAAIKEGIDTGDWNRVKDDVSKAEISILNHPLQTVLMLEGGKSLTEGATEFAKSPTEWAGKKVEPITKTIDYLQKVKAESMANGRKPSGYFSGSAYQKGLADLQGLMTNKIDATKKVADLEKEAKSFTDKNSSEAHANKVALDIAKGQLSDLEKAHDEHLQNTATALKENATRNGTTIDQTDADVKQMLKESKDRGSGVYQENFGSTPMPLSGVIQGLDKLRTYLKNTWDDGTASKFDAVLNKAKITDIIREYESDPTKLQEEFAKEPDLVPKKYKKTPVNPDVVESADGTWYNTKTNKKVAEPKLEVDLDALKKDYPIATSDFIQSIRNNIRNNIIKPENKDAFVKFDEYVDPAFKKTFSDEMSKTPEGQEKLTNILENDKEYANIKNSPFDKDGSLTEKNILDNWTTPIADKAKGLTTGFSEVFKGTGIVEKFQSMLMEKILNEKGSDGKVTPKTISSGLEKYGKYLDDSQKTQLQSLKDKMEQRETQVKTVEEGVKTLNEKQKQIESDASSIGTDDADVIAKIKSINSTDKLKAFMEKTGKTKEQIRDVFLQSVINKVDADLGLKTGAKFDLTRVNNWLSEIKSLSAENPKIRKEILGDEMDSDLGQIEKMNSDYKALQDNVPKSRMGRIVSFTAGLFLAKWGMKFKALSEIKSSLKGSAEEGGKYGEGRERIDPLAKTAREKVKAKIKDKVAKKVKDPKFQKRALEVSAAKNSSNDNQDE